MGDNDLESRADQVCEMEVVCSPSPADETFLSCNHFLLNWFGAVVRGSERQKPGHTELIEGAIAANDEGGVFGSGEARGAASAGFGSSGLCGVENGCGSFVHGHDDGIWGWCGKVMFF